MSESDTPIDIETTAVASTDDVNLALHHFGGNGPPLLICHATGFHGRAYLPFARALRENFDVWALDFRGHGASTAPSTGDFRWKGMGEDVVAVVDAIDNGPVFAIGHSMGGASILRAELLRPGSIKAAYLFEPIVFSAEFLAISLDSDMSKAARLRRPTFGSRAEVVERYGSRPPLNALDIEALESYVEYGFIDVDDGGVSLACIPEHEALTFEAPDKITTEEITGMELALVVARGEVTEAAIPARFSAPTAEAIEGAHLLVHDDLGHFGPLEAPVRIAAEASHWFMTGTV